MKKSIINFLVVLSLAMPCAYAKNNNTIKNNITNHVVEAKECNTHKSKNKGGKKKTGKTKPKFNKPQKLIVKHNLHQKGYASWYGGKFIGRKTASGEVFSATKLTAAHKTLPLGSIVKVTNIKTKQQVTVKINDRGPFKPNRIVDLSPSAARKIGLQKIGVMPIKLEVISTPR